MAAAATTAQPLGSQEATSVEQAGVCNTAPTVVAPAVHGTPAADLGAELMLVFGDYSF